MVQLRRLTDEQLAREVRDAESAVLRTGSLTARDELREARTEQQRRTDERRPPSPLMVRVRWTR